MIPPTFSDPLEHLYVKSSKGGGSVAKYGTFNPSAMFAMKNLIPYGQKVGSISMELHGAMGLYQKCLIKNPQEILKLVITDKRDITRITQQASNDSSIMLKLVDVTNFGLIGVEKEEGRVDRLYFCADWGVSKQDYDTQSPYNLKFAYPLGPPEVLCAAANALWSTINRHAQNIVVPSRM